MLFRGNCFIDKELVDFIMNGMRKRCKEIWMKMVLASRNNRSNESRARLSYFETIGLTCSNIKV